MAEETKDLWGKISDAASNAGKAISDEYSRLKLNNEIMTLKRELARARAHVGGMFYDLYLEGKVQVDDKVRPFFDEITGLIEEIKVVERKVDAIKTDAKSKEAPKHTHPHPPSAPSPPQPPTPPPTTPERKPAESEVQFMSEEEAPGFCPSCGHSVPVHDGTPPNYCPGCGYPLPKE